MAINDSSGEERSEWIIGIDSSDRRVMSKFEMPQFHSYTLVNLTSSEVDKVFSIPDGDIPAIQSLLSKYY